MDVRCAVLRLSCMPRPPTHRLPKISATCICHTSATGSKYHRPLRFRPTTCIHGCDHQSDLELTPGRSRGATPVSVSASEGQALCKQPAAASCAFRLYRSLLLEPADLVPNGIFRCCITQRRHEAGTSSVCLDMSEMRVTPGTE